MLCTVKYRSQDPSYGGVRIASSYIDSAPSGTKSQIQGIFDFVPCGKWGEIGKATW